MARQLPPRQLLIQQLPQLFPGKDEVWIGAAASVLSRTAEDAIAGIMNMADPVKRGFVERELEIAGNTPAGFTGWVRWGPLVLMVLVFCGVVVLQADKYGPESLKLVFSSVLSGLLSALGIIAVLEKAYKLDWPFKYLATVLQAIGGVFRPARAAFSELSMVNKVLSVLIVILCVVVVVFAVVYGR